MILLLSDTITSRLQYVADFIFKENFGVDYVITTNKKDFEESDRSKNKLYRRSIFRKCN